MISGHIFKVKMVILQMGRWSKRVDWIVVKNYYIGFILYLITLLFLKAPYEVDIQNNPTLYISNHLYLYTQYVPAVFATLFVSLLFEETYNKATREFLLTCPIRIRHIIGGRYLKISIMIHAPLTILLLYAASKINQNILQCCVLNEITEIPILQVHPLTLIVQNFVVINFFVILTLFLLLIFQEKSIPLTLVLAYCALEFGPMSRILGDFCVFRGAFSLPDYYHMFVPNIIFLLVLSIILFVVMYFSYKIR